MRLIVFFDLPVKTAMQRKGYRKFRKYLINEGYLMLQESVYAKLVITDASANLNIERLKKNKPSEGLVQVLKVTEKQFSAMIEITGKRGNFDEIDTTEEFLVL